MDNWKIGDKCFYMYGNNPKEGRIKNITFYGYNAENGKIEFSHYKVSVNYSYYSDGDYGIDIDEPKEIFPTKEALMMHLDNLIEKSMHNYKRLEETWKKY